MDREVSFSSGANSGVARLVYSNGWQVEEVDMKATFDQWYSGGANYQYPGDEKSYDFCDNATYSFARSYIQVCRSVNSVVMTKIACLLITAQRIISYALTIAVTTFPTSLERSDVNFTPTSYFCSFISSHHLTVQKRLTFNYQILSRF